MRIFSLAIVALAYGLAAQPASAMPITLNITYEGMPATAENEISSVTFTETGGSFTHPISNLSPELLQLVVMGTLLSDVTFTAFDGVISLGSFTFSDVQFTSVASAGGGSSEQVSFLFDPPSQGFYTLDYPGISPFGEDDIASLTLDQAGASFWHPNSINSLQLLELQLLGTVLPNFTLIPVDASSRFGTLRFENVIFTSVIVTSGPAGDIFEDVSIDSTGFAIEPTAAQVPEPSTWLMTMGGALVLAMRRRAYLRKGSGSGNPSTTHADVVHVSSCCSRF